jgi:hypothetical protein
MRDQFPSSGALASGREWFAVTKSDTVDLPQLQRALWVGTAGDISLVGPIGSAAVVFKNVPAGSILDLRPSRVMSTGTTAADIVGIV